MSSERIIIAAAPGTEWPLTLSEFEQRIRADRPGVRTQMKRLAGTDRAYVDFEIGDGANTRTGAYYENNHFDLSDDTPDFWADIIAWFLSLLPPDAQIMGFLEAVPEPRQLPHDSTPQQIVTIFNELNRR